MKGLLSGTNKFPGIVIMRKRQRGVHIVARKKARKLQDQVLATDGAHVPVNEETDGAEIGSEPAQTEELSTRQQTERPISYDGDKATVSLHLKQTVAMDGWAMVRLVRGRAAVHGYSLSPGVDVLLCSNSKLAAVVAIEAQLARLGVDTVIQRGPNDDPTSSHSDEMSDILEKPANGGEFFGCTLEFQSYTGGSAGSGPSFDAINGESPRKRTFRIVSDYFQPSSVLGCASLNQEIAGVNETFVRHDSIQKRKRDEQMAGGSPQCSGDGVEEEISGSGEDREDDDVKHGDKSVQDQVAMETDDLSDPDNILRVGGDRKKPRKESRTPLNATVIPDSWWSAANSILGQTQAGSSTEKSGKLEEDGSTGQNHRAPIVAVIGPKNAGKSTFARFLLNYLLNSHEAVGYLDTDVGQPEFTVPGCLSLHIVREPIFGSPVLHLRNPERSFFYGDVSPKGDPEMYSRSVGVLFDYFQRRYGSAKDSTEDNHRSSPAIPLVINTHGWIKGIGYDVLVEILRHTSPTHVVQFTSEAENKNLPAGKFWESSINSDQTNLVYIENALEGSNRPLVRVKTAADHLRDSRIMAYFRQCFSREPLPFPYREDKLFAQTALGLVSHPPYQVPVSAVKIWHLHCQVPKSESLYSINGTLVGLGVASSTLDRDNISARSLPSSCVGLGIVRGIDAEKGLLYIITPLAADILQEVDTLLQGRVEIPVPLLQAKGYMSPYLCHNSVAIEGTGSVAMKPQKRFLKIVT